jgi:hypothetical protein
MATAWRCSRCLIVLPALSTLIALSGCPTQPGTVGQNTVNEIHKIATDIQGKVDTVQKSQAQLIENQNKLEESANKQMRIAAKHVGGASYVNAQNTQSNAYTDLTGKELAAAAIVLGPPPEETRDEIIKKLELALSGTKEDMAKLRASYEVATQEAKEAKADRDEALQKVGEVREDLKLKTGELQTTAAKLSSAEADAQLKAKLAQDAQEAKQKLEMAKTRRDIAYGFMGFGGLLMVGAIVATILHVPGVLAAGLAGGSVLLGLGWLLSVLEGLLQNLYFQIALGVGSAGALVVVVFLIWRTVRARKTAELDAQIQERTIGAIQEARNDDAKLGRGTYAALRPYLQEWFVDGDGKPDTALEKEVKRRLVAMNLINPPGAEPSVLESLRPAATSSKGGGTKKIAKATDLTSPPTPAANVA